MVRRQPDTAPDPGGKLQALVVGASGHNAHRVIEERLEVDWLGIEPDASGLNFGHVEDVVDHVEQVLAALMDVMAILSILIRA